MLKKKIGFIGYRGHALRLIRAMQDTGKCEVAYLYHPEKRIDLEKVFPQECQRATVTRNLKDLYQCDALVIASPNQTHFFYIKKLMSEYKGPVFCEKPPVSSLRELKLLKSLPVRDKKRLYFNFNMRFGIYSEILKTFPLKYSLGAPIRTSIISGHGLALDKSYKSSWRSKKELHKAGVLETLGIHYFDLISLLFGIPSGVVCKFENYSPYGNSMDTCHLSCSFENRSQFNLTCSYCVPCIDDIQVNYTNGTICISGNKVRVFGPRDVFDENGRFVAPPLIFEKIFDVNKAYLESLGNSCSYFLDHLIDRLPMDLGYFKQSLLSSRICLSGVSRK